MTHFTDVSTRDKAFARPFRELGTLKELLISARDASSVPRIRGVPMSILAFVVMIIPFVASRTPRASSW